MIKLLELFLNMAKYDCIYGIDTNRHLSVFIADR